ncbi:unnamed protein product [Didymodactylos carnosus]|uniref:Epoxide hydrolase n=1 Tax=Didymodactylos carnosus TaxID=1234261 RepID=A0A815RMK1_9BILA|nr:unnamed protein product [Didymodactylos carnosus]CAF4344297.1 unnamed protein product [Didymodactylos carnosus]
MGVGAHKHHYDNEKIEKEMKSQEEDPLTKLKELCSNDHACAELKEKLDACNDRVNGKPWTKETCQEELLDFLHCVDECRKNIKMALTRLHHVLAFFGLLTAIIYGLYSLFDHRPPCYSLDDQYFGPIDHNRDMDSDIQIYPFKIPFSHSQLDDLHSRLRKTRFYQPLNDPENITQSQYGFNRQTAEPIRDYWLNTFDWQKVVADLNEFSHYKTMIDGINIHFVRTQTKSTQYQHKKAILFLHGWPGSFYEYLDVMKILNTSIMIEYDLITPSLPGYGYSDITTRSKMTPQQIARIFHLLMQRLGHNSYIVVGGDWGSIIGTLMAKLYPTHVKGLLITMVTEFPSNLINSIRTLMGTISKSFLLDEDEQAFKPNYNIWNDLKFLWKESGYFHLQSTKPDTLGYGLNDSPIGLASYILEKFSIGSNNQTEIDSSSNSGLSRFTLDQLLTNIMIYWTTETITSSIRLYYEFMNSIMSGHDKKLLYGPLTKSVPVAISNYRNEIFYTPKVLVKSKFPNIKQWLYHQEGGHFAALEVPKQFVRDIEKFVALI